MSRPQFGRKMKHEIKPCPLCGFRCWVRELKDDLLYLGKRHYRIACGKCDCALPTSKNLASLVRRWNKRKELDQVLGVTVELYEDLSHQTEGRVYDSKDYARVLFKQHGFTLDDTLSFVYAPKAVKRAGI